MSPPAQHSAGRSGEASDGPPDVSVVVPVYNDPDGIETTLESLVAQEYPRDRFEVVVADNGSTDETLSVVRRFADAHDHVRVVEETDVQGSYAARNTGMEAASGDVYAFVDADMWMDDDWLSTAVRALDDAPYVGCAVELVSAGTQTLAGRFDGTTAFPVARYLESQQYAPTCCLLVRRGVVEDVGPFDERFVSGGDSEFGHRVADAGYSQAFAPEATMYHPVRDSIGALVGKELRVGRGLCQRQVFYPDRYGRPGIPPRPSGAKSPDAEESTVALRDRIPFALLSMLLTGVRAVGYFCEFARHPVGGAE